VNGEGTVGHGAIEPEPAPFDAADTSVQLGSHPAGAFLANIYTLLASRDVFNTGDGSEAALAPHAPPFAGSGAAGPDLNALGVVGTVHYAFRGLQLDYLDGDDYNYDLATNVESRVYRGGEFAFYYDNGGGPVLFAHSTDVVLRITIDWDTFAIVQTVLSSTDDTGPGMLAILVGMVGVSTTPVQQSGVTTEGAPYSGGYGVYNDDGSTWEFESIPVAATPVSWGELKTRPN